jgi:hypothetical protein
LGQHVALVGEDDGERNERHRVAASASVSGTNTNITARRLSHATSTIPHVKPTADTAPNVPNARLRARPSANSRAMSASAAGARNAAASLWPAQGR